MGKHNKENNKTPNNLDGFCLGDCFYSPTNDVRLINQQTTYVLTINSNKARTYETERAQEKGNKLTFKGKTEEKIKSYGPNRAHSSRIKKLQSYP